MAYREGSRYQMSLLPPAMEDYVGQNDPVRAYDAIVDAMDIKELGMVVDPSQVGNPAYDPETMLKLLVYGYSYGWRSSRKLERACHHNLSFIWLMGGLKPDHKTIANFRKDNQEVVIKVLKQTARICIKLDLIEGNCLFTDSTKVRGAAAIGETRTKEGWVKKLKEIDQRIEHLLKECNEIDETEVSSLVEVQQELQDKQKLQQKVRGLLEQMDIEKRQKINGTDTDCVNFNGRQGSHAGYSAHITVDEKHGLIVSADVVSSNYDSNQFSNQIEQAVDTLEKQCSTAVADAGYWNESLQETLTKQIDVIVPSRRQAQREPVDNPFGRDKFRYDSENNQYFCPEGKRLKYSYYSTMKGHYVYRIEKASLCQNCTHFGICTTYRRGRSIIRLKAEELRDKLEKRYASEEGQEIYKKRKERVELPFGHIKRNLNGGAFLVRGRNAVKAEWALLASCFNIARMITLTGGTGGLIRRLALV